MLLGADSIEASRTFAVRCIRDRRFGSRGREIKCRLIDVKPLHMSLAPELHFSQQERALGTYDRKLEFLKAVNARIARRVDEFAPCRADPCRS